MKPQKKTYLLPQDLINRVRKIFGTRTETDAIVRAMEEVAFRNRVSRWHQKNAGLLKIRNLYAR